MAQTHRFFYCTSRNINFDFLTIFRFRLQGRGLPLPLSIFVHSSVLISRGDYQRPRFSGFCPEKNTAPLCKGSWRAYARLRDCLFKFCTVFRSHRQARLSIARLKSAKKRRSESRTASFFFGRNLFEQK